ncbi:hypothetical protein FSP39_010082 [Pinctada imbricata]|uniref:MRH domain-containing protein n=1 Tax=Pinctada imbricata TaxID=66713 RepID=A0AA88YDV7_PINIB|nr:hypothetical protein FSP39_010082 [Pinctada imbricata]
MCNQISGEPANQPSNKCNRQASICMTKGNNSYSIFDYDETRVLQSYATNNESDEFWIIGMGDKCPGSPNFNLSAIINFKCGENIGSPEYLDFSVCTSYFEWRTILACKTKISDKEVKCSLFDKGEKRDLSALIKTKGGYLADTTEAWSFMINVCRDITPDGITLGCPVGAGACIKNNATGVADNYGWPRAQLKQNAKGNLQLIYTADVKPSKCTANPTTTIEFICPDVGGSEDPKLVFQFNCQFRVEWKTEHACPMKTVTAKNSCVLKQEDRNIDFNLQPLSVPPDYLTRIVSDHYDSRFESELRIATLGAPR